MKRARESTLATSGGFGDDGGMSRHATTTDVSEKPAPTGAWRPRPASPPVDRVMVGSFSDARIAEVRRRVGDRLAVSAGPRLTARLVAQSRGLRARAEWVHAAQVPERMRGVPLVTRRFVEHLHRRDMQVHVWTVNDAEEMHRLLDLGVDGIMTDRTEVLRDVMRARGVWAGP